MTEESSESLEALTRGRLIYPFMEEMSALQEEAKAGPLTGAESARLAKIEANHAEFKKCDEKFNSSYEAGDLEAALEAAQEGLAVAEELAAETLGGR